MEGPTDLNTFRDERIKEIKDQVLNIAQNFLLERTDGDFEVTFGKTDLTLLEVYVMSTASEKGYISAPQYVLNETAIVIANSLARDRNVGYTVDMSQIGSEVPHIRIVKM